MSKIKYVIAGLLFICLLALAGLTYFIWKRNTSNEIAASQSANSGSSPDNTRVLSGSNTEADGLQVAPGSTSSSLGPTSQQAFNNPTGTGTSDNSKAKILDPNTFGQYDKYKSDNSARYIDLLTGDGAELVTNKKAAVLYKVWLTDGTLVDSSRPNENNELEPFVFTVGAHEVIPAWDSGLIGMKTGGVRFLIVPPAVGYGSQPKGDIPANSVLIFQIQLLSVQ